MSQTTINGRSVADIRKDFPLIAGTTLAYLDNAATSQKPRSVIDALSGYYSAYNANPHRGVYPISEQATQAYEGARKKVATFLGAVDSASVIFTRNTTEAINLVAYTWGQANIREGDEIVTTEMEHHSNMVPWQLLAKRKGAKVRYLPFDAATGGPAWSALPGLLSAKTKLVAFAHVSNSLGTINPVAEVVAMVRKHSAAKVLVDSAQGAPHLQVDVKGWDCDFLALSAHKMLGPMGVGVLFGKRELLEAMDPFLGGGDMIREVYIDRESKWNDLPWKFEAGTPNVGGVIALGAAIDYLDAIGVAAIHRHEQALTQHALDRLKRMKGITLYGTPDAKGRCGVVSFNIDGVHPHDAGSLLAREDVAVRVGHHCNMPLMKRLGLWGTTRASFYLYNTIEEVDRLLIAIPKIQKLFS